MSDPYWQCIRSDDHFANDVLGDAEGKNGPRVHLADLAIDAALRSVPLPDGLLTRLDMLVYSLPDEAADSFDYLDC